MRGFNLAPTPKILVWGLALHRNFNNCPQQVDPPLAGRRYWSPELVRAILKKLCGFCGYSADSALAKKYEVPDKIKTDKKMNLLSLAYFTAFLIYIGLIIFGLSKDPKSKLNRVFALFIFTFAIWSFSSAFVNSATSKNNAILWNNISSFGWLSFASFALWFSLVFTKKEKVLKKWYFYPVIFFIPIFFIYKQWTGSLITDYIKTSYGWTTVWGKTIWPFLFYV
ncbi:MAG: histidine kinase N-terminal 7TM domain-containing protein [Elusimicrobiota bacterium]